VLSEAPPLPTTVQPPAQAREPERVELPSAPVAAEGKRPFRSFLRRAG
jgi:hypothetical protein